MVRTTFLLGPSGRFGRHMGTAFRHAGWEVRPFARDTDDLMDAAKGDDVIINGWNPPYPEWEAQVPGQILYISEAAQVSGATLLQPGNVYVYGEGAPEVMTPETPHAATNPLGRVRMDLEAALAASPAQTILLRAGDFTDTEASGNWFDMVMAAKLAKGRFVYPGARDRVHSFAFLPDMARAYVVLAEMRASLPNHADVPFEGYSLTGQQLHDAVEVATGRRLEPANVPRPALALAAPFSPIMRGLR
jgi:nucleoside-diphosphate-sugar epimerase